MFFEKKQMLQSVLFLSGQILEPAAGQIGGDGSLLRRDWRVTGEHCQSRLKEDTPHLPVHVRKFLWDSQRWQRPVSAVPIPAPCLTLQPAGAVSGAAVG